MSIFGPEFKIDLLIKSIERDISKYEALIEPLFDRTHWINNPDLDKFINEFGGYAGAMQYELDQLNELKKMNSGSKIRRIIRIIFEN